MSRIASAITPAAVFRLAAFRASVSLLPFASLKNVASGPFASQISDVASFSVVRLAAMPSRDGMVVSAERSSLTNASQENLNFRPNFSTL